MIDVELSIRTEDDNLVVEIRTRNKKSVFFVIWVFYF